MEFFVVDVLNPDVVYISVAPAYFFITNQMEIGADSMNNNKKNGGNVGTGRRKGMKDKAVCTNGGIETYFFPSPIKETSRNEEVVLPPKNHPCATEQNGNITENIVVKKKHSIIHLDAEGSDSEATFCTSKAKRTYSKKKRVLTASKEVSKQRLNSDLIAYEPPKKTINETTKDVKRSNVDNGRKLTDYFPIRRSERQTRSRLMKDKEKEIEEALLSGTEEGLKVEQILGKGRGVVTTKFFKKGEFVVEYSGELIGTTQARQREVLYSQDQNMGCYMYYFLHNNRHYCVDATEESGRFGRLVNHSRNKGNLITKTFVVDDVPHLILVAKRDIEEGEELLYDYGDRSKVSVASNPWLAT